MMRDLAKPMLLLLLSAMATSATAQERFGIRVSSEHSIQWWGTSEVVLGDRNVKVIETTRGVIRSIWPGPVRGSFAVHTSKGLGVLAGEDVLILAELPEDAVVRSSRVDTLWIGRRDSSGERREIVEWRGDHAARVIVRSKVRIDDFDVAESGRIAYLAAGQIIVTDGTVVRSVDAPAGARRIFMTLDGADLAVVTKSAICRGASSAPRLLSCTNFDEATQAIVRDVWTGRIRVEPGLSANTTR